MFIVYLIGFFLIWGWKKNSTNKAIERLDNDPTNSIKSDKWKRNHGLL